MCTVCRDQIRVVGPDLRHLSWLYVRNILIFSRTSHVIIIGYYYSAVLLNIRGSCLAIPLYNKQPSVHLPLPPPPFPSSGTHHPILYLSEIRHRDKLKDIISRETGQVQKGKFPFCSNMQKPKRPLWVND